MKNRAGIHGWDHRPGGPDAVLSGIVHEVGDGTQFFGGVTADFVNGANASPTDAVPNPTPMSFSLVVGPPNVLDTDGNIVAYTLHKVLIEGDVTDVEPGDVVFVLPVEYRQPTDRPAHAHDDQGNYVACRLLSTGEFLYGVA